MTQSDFNTPTSTVNAEFSAIEIRAFERIRWGAIVAGLFASLSTLIVLTVLGVAVGLSAYDSGDSARGWSVGAIIWSALSMIVAFVVGGWLAGRWGAPLGKENSAVLHGVMVWAVAIPLSLFVLGSIGTMFGSAAITGDQQTARFDVNDSARTAGVTLGDIGTSAERPSGDPAVTETRRSAAGAAWGTLISLLLGLCAAAVGGYLGATGMRERGFDTRDRRASTTT